MSIDQEKQRIAQEILDEFFARGARVTKQDFDQIVSRLDALHAAVVREVRGLIMSRREELGRDEQIEDEDAAARVRELKVLQKKIESLAPNKDKEE